MKRHVTLAAASLVFVTGGSALAETWKVTEGKAGDTRGVWEVSFRGDNISGSAVMMKPMGRSVKYNFAGEIKDGKMSIHRINASDRTDCTYVFEDTRAASFAGSALCDGQSYPWLVTRERN